MRKKGFFGLIVLMALVFAFTLAVPLEAVAKKKGPNPSANGKKNGIKHRVVQLEADVLALQGADVLLWDAIDDLWVAIGALESQNTPIAMATVNPDGTILSGDNVQFVSYATGTYTFYIGETYTLAGFITNVTLIGSDGDEGAVRIVTNVASPGDLVIQTLGLTLNTEVDPPVLVEAPVDNAFQFVVYKVPPPAP